VHEIIFLESLKALKSRCTRRYERHRDLISGTVIGDIQMHCFPRVDDILGDEPSTSSDGQKFEVRADSLNANYSYKYFGKGQGVSVYTFRDERDLLWYSTVFSSADRESAYVIDGLMHNEVVKSDIHSTESYNRILWMRR
jgi:hypothetical protein